MLYFLHSLKCLLHKHGHGCASISLAPQVSTSGWGGAGWMEKVGWAADGAVTISAFTGMWGSKLRGNVETQDEGQRTRHFPASFQDIMDWSRSTVFRHLTLKVHRAIGSRRCEGWERVGRTTWRSSAHGSDLCLRRCTWTWRGGVLNGGCQRR
jgi:hypothetical protein